MARFFVKSLNVTKLSPFPFITSIIFCSSRYDDSTSLEIAISNSPLPLGLQECLVLELCLLPHRNIRPVPPRLPRRL